MFVSYLCSSSRRAMIFSNSPRSSFSTACKIWAGLWGWLQGEASPPSVWQYWRIRACSSSLWKVQSWWWVTRPTHPVPAIQFNSPSVQLERSYLLLPFERIMVTTCIKSVRLKMALNEPWEISMTQCCSIEAAEGVWRLLVGMKNPSNCIKQWFLNVSPKNSPKAQEPIYQLQTEL